MENAKVPLKEGMILYAVPVTNYYGKPGQAIVEKTGRKWAHVRIRERMDCVLFDINTWEQKPTGYGYNKDYSLWSSKEDYDTWNEYIAWKRDFLRYKAEALPMEFWNEVRKLYESKSWNV